MFIPLPFVHASCSTGHCEFTPHSGITSEFWRKKIDLRREILSDKADRLRDQVDRTSRIAYKSTVPVYREECQWGLNRFVQKRVNKSRVHDWKRRRIYTNSWYRTLNKKICLREPTNSKTESTRLEEGPNPLETQLTSLKGLPSSRPRCV